jgi:phosphoglycerate dehydrogenase-like enzyme
VKILISIYSQIAVWNIPPVHVAALRRDFPNHTILHALDDDQTQQLMPEADVLFAGQITTAQFAAGSRLRWIHSPAAGVGGMLFPELLASPVVLTNSRGMSADTIAEHVLAVTLALFRRLPTAFRSQAAQTWAQDVISLEGNRMIANSNVLVVGMGAIGGAVAKRLSMLGARVTGIRRRHAPAQAGVAQMSTPEHLLDLLPDADVVVISAPHTKATRGVIGAPELSAMKRDAILINVSRGQLIDEPALAAALERGAIGGAALDVFVDEPLPSDSPLWTLPNVLITPHTSGFRPDHWDAAVALFADNLRRFEQGSTLVNVVDKQEGY